MPKPPPVSSVREVADEKGVTVQAVRAAIGRGTLTSYRTGSTVLVIRDKALDDYLARPAQPNRKGS